MRCLVSVILILAQAMWMADYSSADDSCPEPAASLDCRRGDGTVGEVCTASLEVTTCSGSGSTSDDGDGGAEPSEPRVCKTTYGEVVPCESDSGTWSDVHSCYVQAASPQPPKSDPIWGGRSDGIIAECLFLWWEPYLVWLLSIEAAPPDPLVMAQQAIDQMNLEAITIGSFPYTKAIDSEAMSYVGLNMWFWVQDPSPNSYGPITKSVTLQGYTLTATAEVSYVVWDFGNGDTIRCGKGTTFKKEQSRNEKSPNCGYFYPQQGQYTITATSYWEVSWRGVGQSGLIERQLSVSEDVTVGEIQVVNVPNDP